MWRILMASLVAVAGLAVAAPRAKDAPKKDSPIVGEWRLLTVNGKEALPATYKFSADGILVGSGWIGMLESGFEAKYTTDEKSDPFRIDLTNQGDPEEGIFKIEGDRLTICYRFGRDRRPTKFGEKDAIEEVLERVKKKKD